MSIILWLIGTAIATVALIALLFAWIHASGSEEKRVSEKEATADLLSDTHCTNARGRQ